MGGPRCIIVSHDPMSGDRGLVLVHGNIFSYAKGDKVGWGPWPLRPPGSAAE